MQSMLRRNKKSLTSRPLGCESLEDRRVLATMVGTEAELRAALEAVPADDCVVLTADIALTTGQVLITSDGVSGSGIEIDGAGFTVTGTGTDRVFGIDDGDMITDSFTVTFRDITITGGGGVSFGGGVASQETLVFESATVTGNRANNGNGNYTATGGGIDAAGDLTLNNSTVSNNTASDMLPGYLSGLGGGVNVDGAVTIYNSNIDGNDASNRGGGIAINGVGPHVITGSTFDNNVIGSASYYSAPDISTAGGGVYVDPGAGYLGLDLTISSSSMSGNVAGNVTATSGGTFDYGHGLDITTRGPGDIVNLDDLTVSNNSSTTDGIVAGQTSVQRGIGIALTAVEGGTFNLSNSLISGNVMSPLGDFPGYGGGVSTQTLDGGNGIAYSGYFNLLDNQIVNNTGLRGAGFGTRYGGGYYNDGIGAKSIVNITGGTISGNTADGDGGGSMWNWIAQDIRLNGVTMDGNYDYGGGGAVTNLGGVFGQFGIYSTSNLYIYDSTISNNYSLSTGGGLNITTSLLTYAGVYPNNVEIHTSTVTGNSALANGGGVYGYDSNLTIYNSTLSGNYSPGTGGGVDLRIACDTSGGGGPCYTGTNKEAVFIVDRVTIADNVSYGGATLNVGDNTSATVANTLVSGNTNAGDDFAGGGGAQPGVVTVDYSLIENDPGMNAIIAAGTGNITGMSGDIGPLADNGGPTFTHALNMTSPAIGTAATGYTGTDQRGFATGGMLTGTRDDIGAYEYGAEMVDDVPVDCDFNDDGDCDLDDLDMLTMEITAGTNNLEFDLNDDGVVDILDVTDNPEGWLAAAGARPENAGLTGGNPFLAGDFNLDGVVDGQDFIVWNANKFTNTGGKWSLGDGNADGITDGQDFIIWNLNKFMGSMPLQSNGPQTELDSLAVGGNTHMGESMKSLPAAELGHRDLSGGKARFNRAIISSSDNSLANGFVADAALDSKLAGETEAVEEAVEQKQIVRAPALATRVFASDSSIRENAEEVEAVDSVFEKLGL
ncbi:MAG: choice-of-anchor Q domain-containing protein [Planctomycetota bacterium]